MFAGWEWHGRLLLEPWGKDVRDVARLTAWQAEHLYVRAAAALAGAARGESPEHDWTQGLPDKALFVASMDAKFPHRPRAEWEAAWERMNAR